MIRALACFLIASPVAAWEFSPAPICTLSHAQADVEIAVTFDHATALYAVAITTPDGWPDAPVFSMRFDGPRPNMISTPRHTVTGNTLQVVDTGFGNVLDGLEFNTTATAFTDTAAASITLDGIAEPIQSFRACLDSPSV